MGAGGAGFGDGVATVGAGAVGAGTAAATTVVCGSVVAADEGGTDGAVAALFAVSIGEFDVLEDAPTTVAVS